MHSPRNRVLDISDRLITIEVLPSPSNKMSREPIPITIDRRTYEERKIATYLWVYKIPYNSRRPNVYTVQVEFGHTYNFQLQRVLTGTEWLFHHRRVQRLSPDPYNYQRRFIRVSKTGPPDSVPMYCFAH